MLRDGCMWWLIMIRSSALVMVFIFSLTSGGDAYGSVSVGHISSQLKAYSLTDEAISSIKKEEKKSVEAKKQSRVKPSSPTAAAAKRTSAIKNQTERNKVFVSGDFKQWYVPRGVTLYNVLQHWTKSAGWSLVWDVEYQFELMATATFSGDFVSATRMLMSSLGDVQPKLYIRLYPENKVVIVSLNPSV